MALLEIPLLGSLLLGDLLRFDLSLSAPRDKLMFSLSFLLHGSVGTRALSPGILRCTPAVPPSRRGHTGLYISAPDRNHCLSCWVRSTVWNRSKFNLLHFHLSPKPCKYHPLPCYFGHSASLFASLHYFTVLSWFQQTLKFFLSREIYLYHCWHFLLSCQIIYFNIRWHLFNCKHATTEVMHGNNFGLLFK